MIIDLYVGFIMAVFVMGIATGIAGYLLIRGKE